MLESIKVKYINNNNMTFINTYLTRLNSVEPMWVQAGAKQNNPIPSKQNESGHFVLYLRPTTHTMSMPSVKMRVLIMASGVSADLTIYIMRYVVFTEKRRSSNMQYSTFFFK